MQTAGQISITWSLWFTTYIYITHISPFIIIPYICLYPYEWRWN